MTGYDSKRRIALDRLDDDNIQVYAKPEGKIMTEEEARTLEAMKYAASMGYPSSMLKDMFAPFTIKRGVVMAQPVQEPVAINQYRVSYCADWYDGIPDRLDGHGPYEIEVRTLYTNPPKRPWVGLTNEEKHEIRYSHMTSAEFIEFIEAALRSKNT